MIIGSQIDLSWIGKDIFRIRKNDQFLDSNKERKLEYERSEKRYL
jgi:hypothetical protein